MSSLEPTLNPALADAPEAVETPRHRTYIAQVAFDTLARWRTRIGLTWIVLLAFLAVFAPFLANSDPLLLKMDGHWSSPLLKSLAPADVVLPLAFFAAVVLAVVRSLSPRVRFALWLWFLAAVIPFALWPSVMYDRNLWIQNWGAGIIWTVLAVGSLLVGAVLVLVPLSLHLPAKVWGVVGACVAGIGVLLVLLPVRPPAAVVHERYREAQEAGKVQFILRAPIPYSPGDRLRDQPERRLTAPSSQHWMGTELNGADVLSRMIHASRIALAIGFIATGIALAIGCFVGGLMGYFAGTFDILGMRLIEIFESIPTLFLLITFVAFFPRNLYVVMVIIGVTGWSGYARFIRAEFLRLRHQDFVQAAIAAGLPLRSVLFRHMLPNGITPVLVSASFGVASAILSEATLSFLGLGLVDEPSWGQLLNQATGQGGAFQWWLAVYPGLAIFLTVFAYNLIGESLRDTLDPRLRGIE